MKDSPHLALQHSETQLVSILRPLEEMRAQFLPVPAVQFLYQLISESVTEIAPVSDSAKHEDLVSHRI